MPTIHIDDKTYERLNDVEFRKRLFGLHKDSVAEQISMAEVIRKMYDIVTEYMGD